MRKLLINSFNWPNVLTLARIPLALAAFWSALNGTYLATIAAMVLFAIAAITDLLDGIIARRYGKITTFGKITDPIADKILVLGAFAVFSYLGLFPFWIVLPIIAREVTITVLRLYFLTRGIAIAAVQSGKQKTVMQLVAIGVIYINLLFTQFFYNTFSASNSQLISMTLITAMYATLALAVWLTLYSGYIFFKNNWKIIKVMM